jgi:hypothetical protein
MERGSYIGDSTGGEVEIMAAPGDIIRDGQRDGRGNNTVSDWSVVTPDYSLRKVNQVEARKLFRASHSTAHGDVGNAPEEQLMTYSVVVRNPNAWTITDDGRRVFEEVRRCGHAHQTVDAAAACLTRLTQWYCLHEEPTSSYCEQCGGRAAHDHTSGAWWKAQVEDSPGNLADTPDPEWDAMFAKAIAAYTSTATPNNRVLVWSVKQAQLAHAGKLPPAKTERVHELFLCPVPAWAGQTQLN